MNGDSLAADRVRLRLAIRGAVQGVGFRPFVCRLATTLGLTGWVNNSPQGVFVEVEGGRSDLEQFLLRVDGEKPPNSSIQNLEPTWLDPAGYAGFEIRPSATGGPKATLLLPDIATCPECLREIFDPANRRFEYPFTNCTHCGPRFSIIEGLPYDRAQTSMKDFTMCPACRAEYENPADRRFHAQPNACPKCGPQLALWDATGQPTGEPALEGAARAILEGQIVAVKGLGGFHLVVDASSVSGITRLRERKHREEKPFAVMFPGLDSVRKACEVSPLEERLLRSPECPIVLVRRRDSPEVQLPESVAPGNPYLGVMLPYTPLHHLLLAKVASPVVATSANLSDEPICIDETEAVRRLSGIADLFLVHNRPIVRHVDDSIARIMAGRELVLRRARGYAPLPIHLPAGVGAPTVLAVGAHLKNTVTLAVGTNAFLSQHIGDLETEAAHHAFGRVIADFERMFDVTPEVIGADEHPDYLSSRYARKRAEASGMALAETQHHIAHVLACMAENEIAPPVLGVSWDGTGYGTDGTVWGGEFFVVTGEAIRRVGWFRRFRLPGGDAAVKEPRRTALGLLHAAYGPEALKLDLKPIRAFTVTELSAVGTMLARGINSPETSSVGRLFDAVAALAGLRQRVRFEGQAAMELEFAADKVQGAETPYPFAMEAVRSADTPAWQVDWIPMLDSLVKDIRGGVPIENMAMRFHLGLSAVIVEAARRAKCERVLLTGGCFQNRVLTELSIGRLRDAGFRPYWHQRVPPNDGGISLGQAVHARAAANRWANVA